VLSSTLVGFITVGLNYLAPDTVFLYLVNTSGAIALLVWLVIAVSQLILRHRMGADAAGRLSLKMWVFPYLTWFAIISIVALLIGMAILEKTRQELLISLLLAGIVVGIGLWRYRGDNRPRTDLPIPEDQLPDPTLPDAPRPDEVPQPA
jgi:GABA permease